MQIQKIALSRLLKLEIPQLAKGVLDIVEKHAPENLLIEKAFNDFNLLTPEIESLIVRYGPHPVTEQLEPVRQRRILFATAISFQVRGLVKGYIDGAEDNVRVMKEASNRYLHNLRANNEEIINERIEQFLQETRNNEELSIALSALGFSSQIDSLAASHNQFMRLVATRNASISRRAKGVTTASSKAVRDGLSILFTRITVASLDNEELDYNPLISELNEKLIRYGGLIKTRETSLKKSKETNLSESENEVPSNEVYSLRVTSVNADDSDYNQGQKTTVAPSGKLLQLSPINNEV